MSHNFPLASHKHNGQKNNLRQDELNDFINCATFDIYPRLRLLSASCTEKKQFALTLKYMFFLFCTAVFHIDGLEQDCNISIVNVPEIL